MDQSPQWWDRARAWVIRALGVGLPTLSGSGAPVPTAPQYDVDQTMATMATSPWVWACVQAIVTDLCGLPLVVEQGTGLKRQQTTDHPILRLLEAPSPRVSGRRFRRQLVADLALTGNAYIRVWRDATGRPSMLGRILPGRITALVGADGEVASWRLANGGELTWADVLHISDVSWSQEPELVYGQTPIAPIALGLQVQRDSRRQSGRSARRGRLEMMLTPGSPDVALSEPAVAGLTAAYANATSAGHGLYVVNKQMVATPLTLSARDGEFLGIEDRTRAEVLAVFGVPPVRVSEPAANYGTAKQQMRTYWETLQGRAALIDDELSRLCEPGTRVRHSFASVEALQTSTTERLDRAVKWTHQLGMRPNDAASYEGFVDAPVPNELPEAAAAPAPTTAPAPPVDEPRELSWTPDDDLLLFGAMAPPTLALVEAL